MEVSKEVLEKWSVLIEAAKKYWVTSEPTGMTDAEFDAMEIQAYKEDGFYARDYVLQTYSVGKKTKNQWIDKITKFKIEGSTMLDAMKKSADELGIPLRNEDLYVAYFGENCKECGNKMICNGCSKCGKCYK